MREILLRRQTSEDRKKRVIASYETINNPGVHTVIQRHFVCLVKEIKKSASFTKPLPYLQIVKERNRKKQIEKFFCKIKGSMLTQNGNRLFLILFMHTLKIKVAAISKVVSYT